MDRKLRIAQLVLPWISVPPKGYGGTEMIVHLVTEELVRRGHDVTLFSVGDSITEAKLDYIFSTGLGLQENVRETLASSMHPLMHVAHCFEKQDDFDIIHSHAQFLGLPFAAVAKTPTVNTFHQKYSNLPQDQQDLINHYKDQNYISISNSQRVEGLNFIGTAYNGIDINSYPYVSSNNQDYLLWAGRLIDKKGPKEAIEVAKRLDLPLVMIGAKTDLIYFKEVIEPELSNEKVKLVEISDRSEMAKYYQDAKLVLMPVKWNEPFGLTATESMSCGTPVVAYSEGAIPETVKDGETGFVVGWQFPHAEGAIQSVGVEGLAEAAKKIWEMGEEDYKKLREQSRKRVEDKFTVEKMVDSYEEAYLKVLNK